MDIAAKIRAQIDREMMGMLGVSTSTVAEPSEPLTIDKLQDVWRKAMLNRPKPETWLSTKLFSSTSAMRVEGADENFLVAHPTYWTRVQHETNRRYGTADWPPGSILPYAGVPIIEIDPWEEDSPETAMWRAAHLARLREAIEAAMIPLPDWLNTPPKFGKHS